jgi:hypothetical protein
MGFGLMGFRDGKIIKGKIIGLMGFGFVRNVRV